MSEGGQLPWKRQSIDTHRGPSSDYSSIQSPLPTPPKGYTWVCNSETREWSVLPIQEALPVQSTKITTKMTKDDVSDPHIDGTVVHAVVVPDKDCDYITHAVQSTDTFQGLCIKYKVSPTVLRQLNHFSGSNLALAPHTLIMPSSSNKNNTPSPSAPIDPHEQSIHHFLHAIRFEIMDLRQRAGKTNVKLLSRKEAIAYLDMNEWNVDKAVQDAKEDIRWEVTCMR